MTSRASTEPQPFLELRVGGLRVPYRLLSLVAAIAGGGATWVLR